MSISIWLSGDVESIKKELEAASVEIDTVLDVIDNVKTESVTVQISSNVYVSSNGDKVSGASYSIVELAPLTPPSPPDATPPSES